MNQTNNGRFLGMLGFLGFLCFLGFLSFLGSANPELAVLATMAIFSGLAIETNKQKHGRFYP